MTIHRFIRENRTKIDFAITKRVPNHPKLNDKERRQWVLNDEGLYNWARSAGVKI